MTCLFAGTNSLPHKTYGAPKLIDIDDVFERCRIDNVEWGSKHNLLVSKNDSSQIIEGLFMKKFFV